MLRNKRALGEEHWNMLVVNWNLLVDPDAG